jgi:hypothetical protein
MFERTPLGFVSFPFFPSYFLWKVFDIIFGSSQAFKKEKGSRFQ